MEEYKQIGIKLTPQRLAVLRFLNGNTSHPSAEEVFEHVRRTYPMISIATVYNTLDTLKERGRLIELTIDPRRKRYDPDTQPHNHVICGRCGAVADIFTPILVDVPEKDAQGFKIIGSHIEFQGLCPLCSAQKNH